MTTATTTSIPTAQPSLPVGTVVNFRGTNYRIEKVNKVNWRVSRQTDNALMIMKRGSRVIVQPSEGSTSATVFPPSNAITNENMMDFGQPVKYLGNNAKIAGKEGLIFSVNQVTYGVVFKNVGAFRMHPSLLEAI